MSPYTTRTQCLTPAMSSRAPAEVNYNTLVIFLMSSVCTNVGGGAVDTRGKQRGGDAAYPPNKTLRVLLSSVNDHPKERAVGSKRSDTHHPRPRAPAEHPKEPSPTAGRKKKKTAQSGRRYKFTRVS